jgi:hypothetical protein
MTLFGILRQLAIGQITYHLAPKHDAPGRR